MNMEVLLLGDSNMALKHSRITLIFFVRVHTDVLLDAEDLAKFGIYEAAFDPYGYVTVKIAGIRHKLHRAVLDFPESNVDHINLNKRDCRKSNLRLANQSQNIANSEKRSTNTSGYKGVFWHKRAKKWMAQLMYNGRSIYLGLHPTKEAAAIAYNTGALKYFGEYARLNVIAGA